MKKTVLVKYGMRKIPISFMETASCTDFDAFQLEFAKFRINDSQLKLKPEKIAIFSSFSELFKEHMELTPGSPLSNGGVIFLSFINPLESPLKMEHVKSEVC